MENFTGREISKYHIIEKLGEGGMAVVYKAFDTSLDRFVAIKFIHKETIAEQYQAQMLLRFEREAKVLASLDHPNIVTIFEYGEYQGSPYLVEKFVPGGELHPDGRPMPYQQAASLLAPVARALEYAHSRGVIHRDIKPANILISETGAPTLSDFGIAKILDTSSFTSGENPLTSTGMQVGTPEYMAPEQWQGKPVAQSDIYALGVVLFELVTGRVPYTADTPAAVMIMQATESLPHPRQFVPGLPESLEAVLFKALAVKPENRYANMGEFAAALELLAHAKARPLAAPGQSAQALQTPAQRAQSAAEEKAQRETDKLTARELKQQQANEEKVRRLAARLAAQENDPGGGRSEQVVKDAGTEGVSSSIRERSIHWPIWLGGGAVLLGLILLVVWLAGRPGNGTPVSFKTLTETALTQAVISMITQQANTSQTAAFVTPVTIQATSTLDKVLTLPQTATFTETAIPSATFTPQVTTVISSPTSQVAGPPALQASGYYGIAVDQNFNIYVSDTGNHRIRKYSSDGTLITQWGSNGNGKGQFNFPHGIDVGVSGYLLVADTGNHRIQKFTTDGKYILEWGSPGSAEKQFNDPWDIVIDSLYHVFVADTYNQRIQMFMDPEVFFRQWGSSGSTEGKLNYPQGIAVNRSGDVYVTDTNNNRVQKFNPSGAFLAQWGAPGSENGQFMYPQGIVVDRDGNIYVADAGNHRVQKFDYAGHYLTQWGGEGSGPGQFSHPSGIALDLYGNVYVTDADTFRIQKFDPNGKFLTQWGD